jgi:hypothetical protein
MVEWFVPGSAPRRADDWQRGGLTRLPPEYDEWLATTRRGADGAWRAAGAVAAEGTRSADSAGAAAVGRFRIVSPKDGDRYRVPPGVDARYATVALRAAGEGANPGRVRWFIDGAATGASRFTLVPGTHVIRAVAPTGAAAEARIVVE